MRLFWKWVPLSDSIPSGVPCRPKMCLSRSELVFQAVAMVCRVCFQPASCCLCHGEYVALALLCLWPWFSVVNLPGLTVSETQPPLSIPRRFHSCGLLDCTAFHVCMYLRIVVQDKCLLKGRIRASVVWEWVEEKLSHVKDLMVSMVSFLLCWINAHILVLRGAFAE